MQKKYCLGGAIGRARWTIVLMAERSCARCTPAHCKQPWASCQPTVCSGQLSLPPLRGR